MSRRKDLWRRRREKHIVTPNLEGCGSSYFRPSLPSLLFIFPSFLFLISFPFSLILYLFDFFVIALFFVFFSFFDNFLWLSHSSMRSTAKFHNKTRNTRMWVIDCASFIWANSKIPTFTSPFLHLDSRYHILNVRRKKN
jgi:hypothetical protein